MGSAKSILVPILEASCFLAVGTVLTFSSLLLGLNGYVIFYLLALISLLPLSLGLHFFISIGAYAAKSNICNCFFCKKLIHPLIKVKSVEEEKVEEVYEEVVEEVREEKPGTAGVIEAPLSAPPQPVIDIDKIKETIVGELSQLVNTKLKEFALKVEGVEGELQKVREEVGKNIEEVRNALIDVRSAIAEISNPFNILRMYPRQEGVLPKASQGISEFEKSLRLVVQGLAAEEESKATPLVEKPPQIEGGKVALSGLLKLVKLIDDLLTEYPKDVVVEMISSMKLLKGVEGETVDLVLKLVNFVENARNQGFDIVELMTRIYTFAMRLGVKDEEASEEIFKFLTKKGKRGD